MPIFLSVYPTVFDQTRVRRFVLVEALGIRRGSAEDDKFQLICHQGRLFGIMAGAPETTKVIMLEQSYPL